MQAKLQAIEKFQKVEQQKRDLLVREFESMRLAQARSEDQLAQLIQLKNQTAPNWGSGRYGHRENLVNYSRLEQMISKLIIHQQHEQAIQHAQCTALKKQLEHKQQQVQGLENTISRWQTELRAHQQTIEDIALEDTLVSYFARKPNQ